MTQSLVTVRARSSRATSTPVPAPACRRRESWPRSAPGAVPPWRPSRRQPSRPDVPARARSSAHSAKVSGSSSARRTTQRVGAVERDKAMERHLQRIAARGKRRANAWHPRARSTIAHRVEGGAQAAWKQHGRAQGVRRHRFIVGHRRGDGAAVREERLGRRRQLLARRRAGRGRRRRVPRRRRRGAGGARRRRVGRRLPAPLRQPSTRASAGSTCSSTTPAPPSSSPPRTSTASTPTTSSASTTST